MKKVLPVFLLLLSFQFLSAQKEFRFAHVSDTHIGSQNSDDDLRRTVKNINADSSIAFAILSGDITDFGSDDEIKLAKQILDSLNKPWYIIPGNHDANWSESGTNSFTRIFGGETFDFTYGGYLFLGTVSGPNMRMSPGQVSRENIVWLDSVLSHLKDKNVPIIFVNHYPQDTSLNNWYEIIDLLKKRNTQLIICGHGHANHLLNFEGIPAVMGRSNLRAKKPEGGYNVVTIANGKAVYEERNPVTNEQRKWTEVDLVKHNYAADTNKYFRPSYDVNKKYSVKKLWSYQDNSDIGSAATLTNHGLLILTNTKGWIYALNGVNGKKVWQYHTKGKIYSTPATEKNSVVVSSTDRFIYCLDAASGKLKWKFETRKPIVANAIIHQGTVFVGSSDGSFRALDLTNGKLKWSFDSVKGFVVTKPLFYRNKIFFGTWGTQFYALDAGSGRMVWQWNNGSANRMYSPAACYPVAANGRVFIVAPDRYMTAFDSETGTVIWRRQDAANRVRESMGISDDSSMVYAKTMDGFVIGVSTSSPEMNIVWRANTELNYEIAPTAIVEFMKTVYIPSDDGTVAAVNSSDGSIVWKYKISNCLVSGITPIAKNKIVVTTMDGHVVCLSR